MSKRLRAGYVAARPALALLAGLLALAACGRVDGQERAAPTAPAAGPRLVFVKQKPAPRTFGTIANIFGNHLGQDPARDQPVGGALCRLDPDGTVTRLTSGDDVAVRDPEISYDGERVVFSMKRGGTGAWQIHEMPVAGGETRLVSRDPDVNDWDPVYLPGSAGFAFASDRLRLADGYENQPSGQLFTMDADGGAVRVINSNAHGAFNPQVGANGHLFFTQWDFHDFRQKANTPAEAVDVNRFLVWETHLDGCGTTAHPIFGTHLVHEISGGYTEVREIPDGSGDLIATRAPYAYTWGSGALVRITPRTPTDAEPQRLLTPDMTLVPGDNTAGRFRSPYALRDGRIVASYAKGAVFDYPTPTPPDFDLVFVREDGSPEVLHADPDFWDWQAVEVVSRTPPAVPASPAKPGFPYAIMSSRDVELHHVHTPGVANQGFIAQRDLGTAKSVRIHQLDLRANREAEFAAYRDPTERLLGVVPVQDDGSFAAVVPARTMLIWETLDADGNVLVKERYWLQFAPGEVQVCNGCHSPHDGSTGRTTNRALASPTNLTEFDVDKDGDGVVDLLQK